MNKGSDTKGVAKVVCQGLNEVWKLQEMGAVSSTFGTYLVGFYQ